MNSHPELLTTAEQIADLAGILKTKDIIAFDTEFIRETTFFPTVEIIQVATEDESWLVDARAFWGGAGNESSKRSSPQALKTSTSSGLQPLLDIFTDPNILKILHAAQGDQECLYTSFGVVATPSLDTAVAAALTGYGEGIGLGNLLKAAMGVTIKKGHARTNWSVRPLPAQLLEYAHADVTHLVPMAKALLAELEKRGRREWALKLSAQWENKALYEVDAETLAEKLAKGGRIDKAGYAALVELVRWREERVRQLNVPRRWVADDHVLVDLAHVRPKDMEHLGAFRGLNKGELKSSGEAILAALKRAEAQTGQVQVPRSKRVETPTVEESQMIELLKCYVGLLADQHRIALRFLIASSQWLPLLRSEAKSPEDLVTKGILDETAARLIGGDVLAFLSGKRALSLQQGHVKIVEIPS